MLTKMKVRKKGIFYQDYISMIITFMSVSGQCIAIYKLNTHISSTEIMFL